MSQKTLLSYITSLSAAFLFCEDVVYDDPGLVLFTLCIYERVTLNEMYLR